MYRSAVMRMFWPERRLGSVLAAQVMNLAANVRLMLL